jgi:hypothetical protein
MPVTLTWKDYHPTLAACIKFENVCFSDTSASTAKDACLAPYIIVAYTPSPLSASISAGGAHRGSTFPIHILCESVTLRIKKPTGSAFLAMRKACNNASEPDAAQICVHDDTPIVLVVVIPHQQESCAVEVTHS